jgi:hypothetical protein
LETFDFVEQGHQGNSECAWASFCTWSRGISVEYIPRAGSERSVFDVRPTRLRTLCDCVTAHVAPELIDAAVKQARGRGLIDKDHVKVIRARARAA